MTLSGRRMRFSILSNGTLITDEMARFLASTGRCDSVQVSIDGSTEATHDAFRGKGTFFKAVSGLKSLIKHDLPATVRVTIHRKNVRDLEAVSELLLEEIGLPGFSTNYASHLGLCQQNAEQVQLTAEERALAMMGRPCSGCLRAQRAVYLYNKEIRALRHWRDCS